MALSKFNKNVENIIALDDNPNEGATPLSSSELKERFDQAGVDIKNYINNTLTSEIDTTLANTNTTIGNIQSSLDTVSSKAEKIGEPNNLNTTVKTDLVSAINEVNTNMNTNKVLWSGGYYMVSSHTAILSEPVSSQKNGIVLVWSAYEEGQRQDYHWNFIFVPKQFVSLSEGNGVSCFLTGSTLGSIGCKYVYVSNDRITGYAQNEGSGTRSGISYNNSKFVLRYVIGV